MGTPTEEDAMKLTDDLRNRLTDRWNDGCVTRDEPSDETLIEYAEALVAEGEAL